MKKKRVKFIPGMITAFCMVLTLLTISLVPAAVVSAQEGEEGTHENDENLVIQTENPNSQTASEQLDKMFADLPDPSTVNPLDETMIKTLYEQVLSIYDFAEVNDLELTEQQEAIINSITEAMYPQNTLAANDGTFKDDQGIRYRITGENTVSVISNTDLTDDFIPEDLRIGNGPATYTGEITIPATVSNEGKTYTVTTIESMAFRDTSVTKVSLPNTITKLSGFYNCAQLTEVVLQEGLLEIASMTFENCTALSKLDIPSTVTTIGTAAFGNCKSLESLHIPAGVTDKLASALVGNTLYPHLENVTIAQGSPYEIEGGVLYRGEEAHLYMGPDENVVLREGTTKIADDQLSKYSGRNGAFSQNYGLKSIVLPDTITKIPDKAFYQCVNLAEITLSANLQEIGERAFYDTDLTELILPDSVQTIGNNAFQGCEEMSSLQLPSALQNFGTSVFRDCKSLGTVIIPEGYKEIPEGTFEGCEKLSTVVIPASVEKIGENAFGKTYIYAGAFQEEDSTLIFLGSNPPEIDTQLWSTDSAPASLTIIVPTGSEEAYAGVAALKTYMTDGNNNVVQNQDYSVSIDKDAVSICVDSKAENTLVITSEIPVGAVLEVTSSDGNILTVDTKAENAGTYIISGKSVGTATVKAVIKLNGIILAEDICEVTVSDHTFKWVVDKEATSTEKGMKHEECEICGYAKEGVEIPVVKPTEPGDNKPGDKPNTNKPNGNTADKNNPQTGDSTNMSLSISLLVVSALCIAVLAVWKKKGVRK